MYFPFAFSFCIFAQNRNILLCIFLFENTKKMQRKNLKLYKHYEYKRKNDYLSSVYTLIW